MSELQKVTDEELVKWISRFKDGEPCPFCAGILPLHKFIIAIDTDAAGILPIHHGSSCSGGDALLFAMTLFAERKRFLSLTEYLETQLKYVKSLIS